MTEPQALQIGSRRRCDNDARPYTVKSENHRFCSDRCRKQFHRYGSPFLRLRPLISKEVERALEEFEHSVFTVLDYNTQQRYRQQFPDRARRFDELTKLAN